MSMVQKLLIVSVTLLIAVLPFSSFVAPVLAQTAEELGVGTIAPPPGTDVWTDAAAAQGEDIALIFFMSNMIKLFSVVMGVWVIFNGILAGYLFLNSSGDSSGYEKARTQITQSVIGLMLIVMAYTFTGLVGLIFFGDAAIFLNPTIQGAP